VVNRHVFNYLDSFKLIARPQADCAVFCNSNDLLLLVEDVHCYYLFVNMCDDAIHDAESVWINHHETTFCSSSCHRAESLGDIEGDNVSSVAIFTLFVCVLPDLMEVKCVKYFDCAHKGCADQADVFEVLELGNFILLGP